MPWHRFNTLSPESGKAANFSETDPLTELAHRSQLKARPVRAVPPNCRGFPTNVEFSG